MNLYKLISNAVKPIKDQIINAFCIMFGQPIEYENPKLSDILDFAYCVVKEIEDRDEVKELQDVDEGM